MKFFEKKRNGKRKKNFVCPHDAIFSFRLGLMLGLEAVWPFWEEPILCCPKKNRC